MGLKKWLKHQLWKDVLQDPQYEEVQVPCPEITIEQISPELHSKLLAEATAAGATFDGTKASIKGLELDWNYDAPSGTLTFTCTKKPFFITCSEVESKIQELVALAKVSI